MPFQTVKIKQVCPTCGGSGEVQWANPPTEPLVCPRCDGSGQIVSGGFRLKLTDDGRLVADE